MRLLLVEDNGMVTNGIKSWVCRTSAMRWTVYWSNTRWTVDAS
jgi:hypothetical protein